MGHDDDRPDTDLLRAASRRARIEGRTPQEALDKDKEAVLEPTPDACLEPEEIESLVHPGSAGVLTIPDQRLDHLLSCKTCDGVLRTMGPPLVRERRFIDSLQLLPDDPQYLQLAPRSAWKPLLANGIFGVLLLIGMGLMLGELRNTSQALTHSEAARSSLEGQVTDLLRHSHSTTVDPIPVTGDVRAGALPQNAFPAIDVDPVVNTTEGQQLKGSLDSLNASMAGLSRTRYYGDRDDMTQLDTRIKLRFHDLSLLIHELSHDVQQSTPISPPPMYVPRSFNR